MRARIRGLLGFGRREIDKEGAYLLPVRLFVGAGWLRAAAEKLPEPGWRDGSELTAFLQGHLAAGDVVFPFYAALVSDVFLPHAAALGWLVMVGELLAGLAILAGFFTNAALLAAIFMNLNFILAGVPDPSAFYFVIQLALFSAGSGAVLGLDSVLGRRVRSPLLVAASGRRSGCFRTRRRQLGALGLLCAAVAAYAAGHVGGLDPAGAVKDPAMILVVLFTVACLQVSIAGMRHEPLRVPQPACGRVSRPRAPAAQCGDRGTGRHRG
jgi:thiosulfate dehydrogenase [quinone] large subunit